MIGIQYQKYFPVEILRLPTGLALYESKFIGEDGTSRIIAGLHPSFTATDTTVLKYLRSILGLLSTLI